MLNAQGSKSIDDVKLYYTSLTGAPATSKSTSLASVPGQVSVAVADVVKTVGSGTNEVGTLHIRSKDADKLAVAASLLATNSTAGTLGNSIPVMRSDRAVGTDGALYITGLRKDSTTHTDVYIQETAGAAVNLLIQYLAADGSTIASGTETIDAFRLRQLKNIVPANAVSAIIGNTGGGGKIAGYATPVDETSGDSWALTDWSVLNGYAAATPVIIPIAGSVHGANGMLFRSDVAIMSRPSGTSTGTLTYVARDGSRLERPVSLGQRQTLIISDVIASTFGITSDTTGYLILTPTIGSFAVTSRTFGVGSEKTAAFSTGVPVVAITAALKQGATRAIAGLADSERTAVLEARAGTFRTNFALMETSGQAVTVRVTFRFTFPAGDKAQGIGAAYRDYPLTGNGFMMLNSIAGEILGLARLQFGNLQNVEADFQVLDGDGSVLLFTSSIDNASGDSILRTE